MKKRLILKIILNIGLIVIIAWLIHIGIFWSKQYYAFSAAPIAEVKNFLIDAVLSFVFALFSLFILILIDFKGLSYLTDSTIKSMNEKKEATAEAKKQKRIETLEKELNGLKKEK